MSKKGEKKTFEILRSEITFLVDLYIFLYDAFIYILII